MMMIAVYY